MGGDKKLETQRKPTAWERVKSWYTGEDVKQMYVSDAPLENNRVGNIKKKVLTPAQEIQYTAAQYHIHTIGVAKMITDAVTQAQIELKQNGKAINNDFSVKLKNRISRNDTFDKFLAEMVANYTINSESLAIIQRNEDGYGMDSIKTLRPIDKNQVTIESDPETDEAVYILTDSEVPEKKNVIYSHNMIHFKNLSLNGVSAVDLLNTVLNSTLSLQDTSDRSIKNKFSKPTSTLFAKNKIDLPIDVYDPNRRALYQNYLEGILVDKDGNKIDYSDINEQSVAELESYNDQMDMLSNYLVKGDFMIYDEDSLDLKLEQVDPKFYDITQIESVVKGRIEKVFNLPVGYLSITASSTEYSKVYDQFIKVTVQPILKMVERELTRKLLTDEEYKDGYRIEFNIFSKWQTDLKTTMESLSIGIRSGLINHKTSSSILGIDMGDGPEYDTHWISGDLKPMSDWYEDATGSDGVDT